MLEGHTLKGRYKIYERLGMGGAATVYLARDTDSGQMAVVKLVHPHLVDDRFIGRFEREIDLLQRLDNPHVIKLYDWALRERDETLNQVISYIVAEFVEGHMLADIIDTRGALDEPDALAIARQLAIGLSDVHAQGIVHRDVKSQNIMITPANQAKLIDFGIAKGANHATLTDPQHFAGTLYYAPPEQILEAANVDHRADIYALGVVLYEMLTARLPVKAREFGTVASKIITGDLDPITGVTDPVKALVNDMLAREVDDRLASAELVVRRIEAITKADVPQLDDRPPTTTIAAAIPKSMVKRDEAITLNYQVVTSSGQRIPLTQAVTVIGRSHPRDAATPDIDLWALGLEDARTASRRHCRIVLQDQAYYLEDMGSMNGTFLNDDQLPAGQRRPLHDGDRIIAGRVPLTFQQISS